MTNFDDDATLPPRASGLETSTDDFGGLARYELLARLGSGTFGVVHRVRDTLLGRTVAMKVLRSRYRTRPDVVARFVDEAQAAAQLQHPGIIPVYDLGWLDDGSPYFTMREIKGRTLKEAVRSVHAASADGWAADPQGTRWGDLLDAVVRVADAIGYAHQLGVIHRDLKPGNVLLGEHGEVLVVDWGLAKVVAPGLALVKLSRQRDQTILRTATGQLAGTPAYMAPEQARGEVDTVDERSDTYGLGALLYDALMGRAPYTGVSGLHIARAVLDRPPDPLDLGPRRVPDAIQAVCHRALARERTTRYADGAAFAAALRQAL